LSQKIIDIYILYTRSIEAIISDNFCVTKNNN